MAINATRVDAGSRFLKRYLVTATPPHADPPWHSDGPVSRRAAEKRLYELGNHTADIAEAFAAANDTWAGARTAG